MALFNKDIAATNQNEKQVNPVVVRSENVAKELMSVAGSNGVHVSTLDFNLLDTQTYTRLNSDAKEGEWEELASDEVSEIHDGKFLLDEKFELKQMYEIEIFTAVESPLDGLETSIGANSAVTKAYLTIKPGSHVTYYEGFERDFRALIAKKKLRANLDIEIFDGVMEASLSKLMATIRVNQDYTFEKKEMLLVAQGLEPNPTVDDALVLHYESSDEEVDEKKRIDYSKRGYLKSVVDGDLLIEYVKPRLGDPGRNCRGEFLKPSEPKVNNEPTFNVSDKIKVIDSEKSIEYRAAQSGYVVFENGTYDINSEIDVSEISFKTTGSIETKLDADVSINVKESDVMKDAIGMGMEVEVNEINVDGNVGPNAIIRAKKASVEGQTHKSSEIYADELKINIHKGTAYGKVIHITRLEHGVVEADVVNITQAIGGTIRAKEINIELLGSHVTMSATKVITIEKLKGGENTLIIDPVLMQASQEGLKNNEEKILESKREMVEMEKEIEKYDKQVQTDQAAYNDVKKRLLHYKKNGVKMPASFVKKYKQFQQLHQHLEALKKEFVKKEERFDLLANKHSAYQDNIFEAKIINNDVWRNHNEIKFKMVEPQMEILHVPHEGAKEHLIMLVEDDNGEYVIKASES